MLEYKRIYKHKNHNINKLDEIKILQILLRKSDFKISAAELLRQMSVSGHKAVGFAPHIACWFVFVVSSLKCFSSCSASSIRSWTWSRICINVDFSISNRSLICWRILHLSFGVKLLVSKSYVDCENESSISPEWIFKFYNIIKAITDVSLCISRYHVQFSLYTSINKSSSIATMRSRCDYIYNGFGTINFIQTLFDPNS